jgi:hypothetical protein
VRPEDVANWTDWSGSCQILDLTTAEAKRNDLQLGAAEAAALHFNNGATSSSTTAPCAIDSMDYMASSFTHLNTVNGIQSAASAEESAFLHPAGMEGDQGLASITADNFPWSTGEQSSAAAGQWSSYTGTASADSNDPSENPQAEEPTSARPDVPVSYGTAAAPADPSAAVVGSWNTWAQASSANNDAAVGHHVSSVSFMNLMSEFGCVPPPLPPTASESHYPMDGGDAHLEDNNSRRSAAFSALEAFNEHASMSMTPIGFPEDSQGCSLADAIEFSLAF